VMPATQTARRRELNVAAWTLFGVGAAVLVAIFAWAVTSPWVGASWIGLAISTLAILGARDLLDLGTSRLNGLSLVVGSMTRGRRMGIVAASALALASVALIWMVVPVLFFVVALFLLYELMRFEALLECGETPNAPSGVTLIGWALIPTGLGTVPGILMLRGESSGWRSARFALAALAVGGIGFALWALAVNRADSFTTATFVSSGIGLSIGSVIALAYTNGAKARQYFHI